MTATFTELFRALDVEGSEHTAREILQQPDVWRRVADVIGSARAEIEAKIAPLDGAFFRPCSGEIQA